MGVRLASTGLPPISFGANRDLAAPAGRRARAAEPSPADGFAVFSPPPAFLTVRDSAYSRCGSLASPVAGPRPRPARDGDDRSTVPAEHDFPQPVTALSVASRRSRHRLHQMSVLSPPDGYQTRAIAKAGGSVVLLAQKQRVVLRSLSKLRRGSPSFSVRALAPKSRHFLVGVCHSIFFSSAATRFSLECRICCHTARTHPKSTGEGEPFGHRTFLLRASASGPVWSHRRRVSHAASLRSARSARPGDALSLPPGAGPRAVTPFVPAAVPDAALSTGARGGRLSPGPCRRLDPVSFAEACVFSPVSLALCL